ncbi:syncytin-1-like [Lemur catta]|uniref:syncytin-1-like n=1 Tax=Lemur catta TaxID=9447 RepID=UPI001E268997|nr:syncytin-1-like [Lemur catta]
MKLCLFILLICSSCAYAGFGSPPNPQELIRLLYGNPCDCGGGTTTITPSSYTKTIDCSSKIAYLAYSQTYSGISEQQWTCVSKPTIIPSTQGRPGPCPSSCLSAVYTAIHSSCYTSAQLCTLNNQTYYTAILERNYPGTFGSILDGEKYAQASCLGTVGKDVCWHTVAPIHISDGGGPSDIQKQSQVAHCLEELAQRLNPLLDYHPLALPKPRDIALDPQTQNILKTTFSLLNATNPSLAQDCWLCVTSGTPLPTAIPTYNVSYIPLDDRTNCSFSPPFRVQPSGFNSSGCLQGPSQNNSYDVEVGFITFSNCHTITNISTPVCSPPGQVFVCGGNLAYTVLPTNWTGLCILASLLPDISIIPGEEPVPLPSFDLAVGHHRRALQAIPLLIGLGITTAMATGGAGVGVATHTYNKLSLQLINDVQTLSGTINDLQDQIDSLAEVVLQNRKGLDLLTAEQGGVCLALQERCCFYANKSGIVRDKIKKLQEDLIKRRKELFENPLWTGLNGLLPYLLPILGPLLCLLLLITFGPWAFRHFTDLIKRQIDAILAKPIQIHYQRLAIEDGFGEDYYGSLPTGTTC